jgi:ParB-like nuclease family protein
MAAGRLQFLPVDQVELDRTNPRIRRFLEIYSGEPTYDQIALALDVAGSDEDAKGATTPEKLRNSILTNGGITQPIVVNKTADGHHICIDGNTRLYIYRAFLADGTEGDWSKIPALVHEALGQTEVDAIRLQAHLVGPRPWDAYSKAKYLWELQHKDLMPLDRIVAFCGGNKRDVTTAIQAYADMEHYFRPLFQAGETYDTERFSGFVELQNLKVKDAISRAGFSLGDFAQWIRDSNIKNLEQVRKLPRILPDKKAREVFVKKGVTAALDVLEKPELTAGLKSASISQLARALTEQVDQIQRAEFLRLRANPEDDAVRYINDALEALQALVNDLNQAN